MYPLRAPFSFLKLLPYSFLHVQFVESNKLYMNTDCIILINTELGNALKSLLTYMRGELFKVIYKLGTGA